MVLSTTISTMSVNYSLQIQLCDLYSAPSVCTPYAVDPNNPPQKNRNRLLYSSILQTDALQRRSVQGSRLPLNEHDGRAYVKSALTMLGPKITRAIGTMTSSFGFIHHP